MAIKRQVCCRFAPAPTGSLHIGSARTALFVWLFARHHGGKFLLRFEDSDQAVSSDQARCSLEDELRWLGIVDDDTETYRQSERREAGVYAAAIEKLRSKGLIRELRSEKGTALQYVPPEEEIVVQDLFRKPIKILRSDSSESQLSPFIIMRSDGWPTYNFACVVDDIDMDITHVIRGDDILSSTAKQISLYRALEVPLPVFAHLARVFDEVGKPLAKRRGSKSIRQFRNEGFLSEAVVNYLALLGWSHPSGQEILTVEQIIQEFYLERVGISKTCFDPAKMLHKNASHIRMGDPNTIADRLID